MKCSSLRISTLLALVVGTAAAGLSGAASAAPAAARVVAVAPPATAAETEAVRLRAEFGLREDLAWVRAASSQLGASDTDLGVPLTGAEHSEFARRRVLGSKIEGIDKQYAKSGRYAGAWLDQAAGGVLRIALTSAPAASDQAVATDARSSTADQVDFQTVRHSSAFLEGLYARVSNDLKTRSLLATDLTAVAIDLPRNAVVITMVDDAAAGGEDKIYGAYGRDGLIVERGERAHTASTRDIRTGRLYGGEFIHSNLNAMCTVAYADAKSTTNRTYAVTAGHCGPIGTTWRQGLGGTRTFGAMNANAAWGFSSTICDCGAVGPLPAGFGTNQVLVNANAKRTYTATGNPYVGEPLCQSGAASYEATGSIQCGTVQSRTATITTGDSTTGGQIALFDCVQTTARAIRGDSGAPYTDGTLFLGVLSSFINNSSYFSKASNLGQANLHLSYTT